MSYWEGEGGRSYHHTAPINALYGLHESLIILKEEGIENSWKRHMENHLLLREGLEKLNISYLVNEEDRLPQLNAIYIPEGVNDLESRQKLLNDFNLEIGAGLGVLAGKVWRIGLMGHSSKKENIDHCLKSLAQVI
jgi:alanine-glyoxylate transaminase/serine-glyoxylate transaminase/serine-pyruvate transaminase